MFFLTSISVVYFVQKIINVEEKADEKLSKEKFILKHHLKAFSVLMFLFFGFVISFSLWYVFLPDSSDNDLKNVVFGIQENKINCINSEVQGCVSGSGAFQKILSNNLKVLLVTFGFSLFYGAGAVFILVWNASIIGTAIGILVRNSLASISEIFGIINLAAYFGVFTGSILRYAIHGFFEILAYFVGALAGGMLSLAVSKHEFNTKKFRKVSLDVFNLSCLALALLILAALIEIYITPLIF